MSDHTPGPWTITTTMSSNGINVVDPSGFRVVTLPRRADRAVVVKWADAHLIAASPDLYAALADLWLWASEQRTHLDTDPVPDGLGAQVLAALDKAAGQ